MATDMMTLIQSMRKTKEMPAGNERNNVRDDIFQKMLDTPPTMWYESEDDSDIGPILANISAACNHSIPTEYKQKILAWAHNAPSDYVKHKAQCCVISTFPTDFFLENVHIDLDSFQGCLIGQGVGDAVGLPVEGYPSDTCQEYVNQVVKPTIVSPHHRHNFKFGQYSDDTQLTR